MKLSNIPFSRPALAVGICLLVLSGCSKKDSAANSGSTAANTDATKVPTGVGTTAGDTSADAITGTGDAAAVKAVKDEVARRWLGTPQGWYSEFPTQVMIATGEPAGPERFYRQIKALHFSIESSDLSEAQKLNGVTFHGSCEFDHAPYRTYADPNAFGPPAWSEWSPIQLSTFEIELKNGKWSFPTDCFLMTGAKPDPAKIARLH